MEHHNKCHQREFFNDHADRWDEISIHNMEKVEYIISLLGLKGDESIMDVGTGTGILIPSYERMLTTGSVLAVDFSDNMIDCCKRKYPEAEHPNVMFKVIDIYDIISEEEFDIVMCYSCFPHFEDHRKAVEIFARSLKNGGKFIIAHSSSREHINHVHRHGGSDIQDDVLPSIEEISNIIEGSGLTTIFERSDDDYHIIMARK